MTRRLTAVLAGMLLAMVFTTSTTQAQSTSPGGALKSSLGAWAEDVRYEKVVWRPHQMCEDVPAPMHAVPKNIT